MAARLLATARGWLGEDAVFKFTQNGKGVLNCRLGLEKDTKEEPTEWINVVVWGEMAEFWQGRLAKGARVEVSGRIKVDQWVDSDNNIKIRLVLTANSIQHIEKMVSA